MATPTNQFWYQTIYVEMVSRSACRQIISIFTQILQYLNRISLSISLLISHSSSLRPFLYMYTNYPVFSIYFFVIFVSTSQSISKQDKKTLSSYVDEMLDQINSMFNVQICIQRKIDKQIVMGECNFFLRGKVHRTKA